TRYGWLLRTVEVTGGFAWPQPGKPRGPCMTPWSIFWAAPAPRRSGAHLQRRTLARTVARVSKPADAVSGKHLHLLFARQRPASLTLGQRPVLSGQRRTRLDLSCRAMSRNRRRPNHAVRVDHRSE